jgi:hypothetical protein
MFAAADWIRDVLLPLELGVIAVIILGWKTRLFCAIHFLFSKIILFRTGYHYHFDYVVESFSFIFLFAPQMKVFSLDSYFSKNRLGEDQIVPASFSFLLFLGIELIYFDSLFYKYDSELWTGGFAFWMPAAIPHFATGMFPDWLEKRWIVQPLGLLSLILETIFPLILLRKMRLTVLTIALFLHAGITILFPIPLFGLGLCALLLFFFHWDSSKVSFEESYPTFTDSRTDIARWTIAVLLAVSQLFLIVHRTIPVKSDFIGNVFVWNRRYAAKWLGLYDHGVYIDQHFSNDVPILRYRTTSHGKLVYVPSFNEKGYPHLPTITGRLFVTHLFNIRREISKPVPLFDGIVLYLKNYISREGRTSGSFDIFYKEVRTQFRWDFSMDDEIEQRPWLLAGHLSIHSDGSYRLRWEERFAQRMGWKHDEH